MRGISKCRFRTDEYRDYPPEFGGPAWGFVFDATSNHVDGYGSWISFDTYKKPGEQTYTLGIYGYVINENPGGIPQAAYLTGAYFNWLQFSYNLG